MPRNTREWAKRKISMSAGNLDTAGMHLEEVSRVYKEQHPEISRTISKLQEMIALGIVFIERLENEI